MKYYSVKPHGRSRSRRAFVVRMMLLAGLTIAAQSFLPWWSMMAACFLGGLATAALKSSAFLSGFIAVFLVWAGYASYIDMDTSSILSQRVGELLMLPPYPILLILITGITGGVAGGLSALSGELLWRTFFPPKPVHYY